MPRGKVDVVGIAAKMETVKTVGYEVVQFFLKSNLIVLVGHSNNTMKVGWFVETSVMRVLLCRIYCVFRRTVTVSA